MRLPALTSMILACVVFASQVALAEDDPRSAAGDPAGARRERPFEIELTPFLWVSGLNGQLGVGDEVAPAEVGFLDILESLKGTAMADISVRYRRLGVVADGIWLRVGSTQASSSPNVDSVEVTLNSAFGTGAVFFRFEPMKGLHVDPYAGARWWRVKTEVDTEGSCAVCPFAGEDTITWADPVFGARVRYDITDRWYVRGIADVGGGVSKYQWMFLGAAGFRFTDWFSMDAGYRINGVKYDKDGFLFDMNVSGFVTGLSFRY